MVRPVIVRGLCIGEGLPKVIVPIVGKTRACILAKAEEFRVLSIDMVEWRADHYEDLTCQDQLLETLRLLRDALPSMPILFTIRTAEEGGEVSLSNETYTEINRVVAESGFVDLIDVQSFLPREVVEDNIRHIHAAGVVVIGSNHDFHKTPTQHELVDRFNEMQALGVDIVKIAVMPHNTSDVLTLLAATNEVYNTTADRPLISMSMSSEGVISRLSGEVFGSSMTFGAVGETSAPGQIPLSDLHQALDILHRAI